MDIMNQVKESLDRNSNINDSVKENLIELIDIFHKSFPNISLENLKNRLETLNMEELNKDNDIKHILMYELLHIITAKDNYVGFDYEHKLIALNTGYTEILTNNLVGNESDSDYHIDEVIATNLIANMIGNDIMLKAYFTNDFNLINNILENAGL